MAAGGQSPAAPQGGGDNGTEATRAAAKSANAFRTISEVSATLDVPQHVLRFWETKFAQIKPMKRGGGRRYYRPEDIVLLRGIRDLLYVDGYTIKGVQKLLREGGVRILHERGAADSGGDAEARPAAPATSSSSSSGLPAVLEELEALKKLLDGSG